MSFGLKHGMSKTFMWRLILILFLGFLGVGFSYSSAAVRCERLLGELKDFTAFHVSQIQQIQFGFSDNPNAVTHIPIGPRHYFIFKMSEVKAGSAEDKIIQKYLSSVSSQFKKSLDLSDDFLRSMDLTNRKIINRTTFILVMAQPDLSSPPLAGLGVVGARGQESLAYELEYEFMTESKLDRRQYQVSLDSNRFEIIRTAIFPDLEAPKPDLSEMLSVANKLVWNEKKQRDSSFYVFSQRRHLAVYRRLKYYFRELFSISARVTHNLNSQSEMETSVVAELLASPNFD